MSENCTSNFSIPTLKVEVLLSGIILTFKIDSNPLSSIFKYKLVDSGNFQTDNFDTGRIYYPVAFIEIFRTISSVATVIGRKDENFYIEGSFLYATLHK